MGQHNLSRRELMAKGGAAATAAALASTAGCIGTVRDAVPFIGGAPYSSWMPAPGTIGDRDHYGFSYTNYNQVESNEDEFSDDRQFDSVEERLAPADIDWEDVNWTLRVSGGFVVSADYDQSSVADDLEGQDYDDDTDHQGYTIYLGPNERRAIAIDGSNLVFARGQDPVDNAEAIIDTDSGDEDRYVDENEGMGELVSALGDGTFVFGQTFEERDENNPEQGRFENSVAIGLNQSVNGDTADVKVVVVYDSESDVDEGDLEDWVEANEDGGTTENWDDVNYNSNGRKGIIKATVDTDEL